MSGRFAFYAEPANVSGLWVGLGEISGLDRVSVADKLLTADEVAALITVLAECLAAMAE